MKQIPDFGELTIKYRKPVEGCDPTSPMSAHKMSWRWEEGGTGNVIYVSDTELGLDAAAECFKMLFENAMYRISELQRERNEVNTTD